MIPIQTNMIPIQTNKDFSQHIGTQIKELLDKSEHHMIHFCEYVRSRLCILNFRELRFDDMLISLKVIFTIAVDLMILKRQIKYYEDNPSWMAPVVKYLLRCKD
ncbi:hypothetical protein GJ496_001788 [Pomphorhynchus laevis]|nr:hypothetical protein GJ496_001788 [Pomphorhynchus laevis]